jgi:hypothetical protein
VQAVDLAASGKKKGWASSLMWALHLPSARTIGRC